MAAAQVQEVATDVFGINMNLDRRCELMHGNLIWKRECAQMTEPLIEAIS
jgi:hypothetical protein